MSVDRSISALLCAASAALYASTLAHDPVGGDGLLYTTILADGGYGHPPGYPLYSLYLSIAGALPGAAPLMSSMATALLGVAAIVLLYRAARAWELDPPAALFVAVAFGLAPEAWLIHTQAEVFALHHLLAASLLVCAGRSGPFRGLARVAASGLIAGLALAHHHTLVLMLPVGAWSLWLGLYETDRPGLATGAGLLAAIAGLTPYAAILAADPSHFQFPWADVSSWSRLIEVFFRERYGTLELASGGTRRPLLHVGYLVTSAIADTYYVPAAFAAVGLTAALRSDVPETSGPSRGAVACLAATLVLTGPAFAALFNLEPIGYRARTVRKLHLLFELHLVFAAGLGVQILADTFELRRWVWALPATVLAAALVVGWPSVADHRGPEIAHYLEDTFERLPDRAVVLGAEDLNGFGLDYYHRALDRRRDVDYVHVPALTPDSPYARLTDETLPVALPFDGDTLDRIDLLDRLSTSGRPVFVSRHFSPDDLANWPTRPRGTLTRVFPADHTPVSGSEAFRANDRFLANSAIDPASDPPPTTWRFAPMLQYAAIWDRIARRLETEGRDEMAARARQRRDDFAPNYHRWVD